MIHLQTKKVMIHMRLDCEFHAYIWDVIYTEKGKQ